MTRSPLIQLQDVVKTLGANRVLDGVNLSIYRGEITAIIGKSGSGKSVLLKHVIGLYEPDGGAILFDGKLRAAMTPTERKALRNKFSYVFQDTALFDFLNVFENVALPLKERNALSPAEVSRRVRDKLHQLDLHDVELKYPAQLSGGMKKRVALARALVTDPEIVLFDEPTTGLDPIRKNAVHSMILDYQRRFGFTGVVVSHEIPDIFFISQRVAMLDEGRIVFEGGPDEIQEAAAPVVKNFIQGLESPRDDLTGIASQSIGQNRLLQEMSRLQRYQIPFSIVLLAMDNLEDVDRIAGHVVGQTRFQGLCQPRDPEHLHHRHLLPVRHQQNYRGPAGHQRGAGRGLLPQALPDHGKPRALRLARIRQRVLLLRERRRRPGEKGKRAGRAYRRGRADAGRVL